MTEDSQGINVHSKAARAVGGGIVGMPFGVISISADYFRVTKNSFLLGYLFILSGGAVFLNSLYRMGKSIDVKIDKRFRVLNAQESWFGFAYAKHQGDIFDAEQFEIMQTSSSNTRNRKTECFAIEFKSNGNSIRIADEIEGTKGALALIEDIVERNFN